VEIVFVCIYCMHVLILFFFFTDCKALCDFLSVKIGLNHLHLF